MTIDKLINMVSNTNHEWNFGDDTDDIMLSVVFSTYEFVENLIKFHKKVQTIIWIVLIISSFAGLYIHFTCISNAPTVNHIIFRLSVLCIQIVTLLIGISNEILFRKMFVIHISEMMVNVLTIFYQYNRYVKKVDADGISARRFDGIMMMYNDLLDKYMK